MARSFAGRLSFHLSVVRHMTRATEQRKRLEQHVARLRNCRRCPLMHPPPVSGGAVVSKVIIVGQAPGVREPIAGKPFAWTAGKTLFRWFEDACGLTEEMVRAKIYFAAVCRCFPGKAPGGSDRVPNPQEIENCSSWLDREIEILGAAPRHSGRPAGDRAIHPARETRHDDRPKFSCPPCRPAVRPHPTAASIRRVAVASDPAGPRPASTSARAHRAASSVDLISRLDHAAGQGIIFDGTRPSIGRTNAPAHSHSRPDRHRHSRTHRERHQRAPVA